MAQAWQKWSGFWFLEISVNAGFNSDSNAQILFVLVKFHQDALAVKTTFSISRQEASAPSEVEVLELNLNPNRELFYQPILTLILQCSKVCFCTY